MMASKSPAKVLLASCLLCALLVQMCSTSSIPIWEFLTRNEKMSYLYSTFAQLVSVHCKATAANSNLPVNQCKRDLLSYGYEKLQTFSEAQLEALDPYQRGANQLIWSSIIRDPSATSLITTYKPQSMPPSSSIITLPHQQSGISVTTIAQKSQQSQNPIFDISNEQPQHKYAMGMDAVYDYGNVGSIDASTTIEPKTYLSGPLVVRVRPDGTPVEEDKFKPLPRDDDLEAYQGRSDSLNIHSAVNGRPSKHRRIATINALKDQQLAAVALQDGLQPPFAEQYGQLRQIRNENHAEYFYGKTQA